MRFLKPTCFAGLALVVIQWIFLPCHLQAASAIVKTGKMRPYSGIGLLLLTSQAETRTDLSVPSDSPVLYEEPSLLRIGRLETSKPTPYEWVLGSGDKSSRLIVTSRKGGWLRVVYDDAGREAWIKHPRKAMFLDWESFLKGRSVALLVGLQKQYYQTSPQPGVAPSGAIASRQTFRVIKTENDWAMVMSDKGSLTWLRWRDEDGRLLVGFGASGAGNP